jgi:hypothetical protein
VRWIGPKDVSVLRSQMGLLSELNRKVLQNHHNWFDVLCFLRLYVIFNFGLQDLASSCVEVVPTFHYTDEAFI